MLGHHTGGIVNVGTAAAAGVGSRHAWEAAKHVYKHGKAEYHKYMESGTKRKHHEEHHMEPHGHGNVPAAGLEQKGFLPKYVPVDYPTQIVLKLRYCQTYQLRSVATAATAAVPCYQAWKTNDIFAPESGNSGVVSGGAHQPNQRDNWAAQYGFYRVEQFHYKIKVINTASATVNGAVAFTAGQSANDAVVTTMKTINTSDYTNTQQQSMWEQKFSHNKVCQSSNGGKGHSNLITFRGCINPEDYDIDVETTASDSTWTAVGVSPGKPRYFALCGQPLNPTTTAAQLPEIGLNVFVEFTYIVTFAQYNASLRQIPS
jgi:hypothetical protein